METLLVTVPEAAKRLSLGRSTVYQLLMTGELTSVKIGKARRIPTAALDAFLASLLEENVAEVGHGT